MRTLARIAPWSLAAALAAAAPPALAVPVVPNYDHADTSRWRCRLCPFDLATAARGRLRVGALGVADAEARFGRHNGLGAAGAYADAGGTFARRDANGAHVAVEATDLGFDSRYAQVRGGRHGRYGFAFGWQEIPHLISTDGATPYAGRAVLHVAAARNPVTDATERRKRTASVRIDASRRLRLQASYARETKTGTRTSYADFLYQATGLPKPVDQTTEEVGGQVVFTSRPLLLAAEASRARFRNAYRSLIWQDAFAPAGTRTGRLALAPNNVADTVSLHSRATFGRTRFSTRLAWGRHRQNDAFLPYTTNAGLDLEALPRTGLDGRADTFAGVSRLVTEITGRLRLSLAHRERRRDNATPTLILAPVLGEAFPTPARRSRAYALRLADTEATLRYRFADRGSVTLGTRLRELERSPLEIAANAEDAFWIDLAARASGGLVVSLKAMRSARDAAAFRATTRNNPLTRRFYQAAREQRLLRAGVDYPVVAANLALGADIELRDTSYPDSGLGVLRERRRALSFDLTFAPTADARLSAFLATDLDDATTAGSSPFAPAAWRYETLDRTRAAGLVADLRGILHPKFDISATYSQSVGRGRYETVVGGDGLPFPKLVSDHRSARIETTYHWRPGTAVVVHWYWEGYAGADWAADGVTADAIRDVIALGRRTPAYANSYVGLALERRL